MIRRITLSLIALGCLIATADAAPMMSSVTQAKPATIEASRLVTGRSIGHHHYWHHHWHHRWHHRYYGFHRHWHHGWPCHHHHWYRR